MGFVSHLRETLALSSVDAPPFVPAALRGLFDQQTRQLWQDPPPLAPLFEPRWAHDHAFMYSCRVTASWAGSLV